MLLRARPRVLFTVGLMILGALLMACAPAAAPTTPARPTGEAKAEPKYGSWVHVAQSGYKAPHLDPHQTLIGAFHGQVGLAYSGLIRYKSDGDVSQLDYKIVSDLAERWEIPNDTTYIFYLRKGSKWHNIPPVNGREFTADDVVYSLNRIRTPGWVHAFMLEVADKIEAVDKYTVKITTKEPSASFLNFVANGYISMVAKEAVDPVQGLRTGPTIGTGAFILDFFDPNIGVHLKKNPDFYEPGLPYLDGVKHIQIPDASARLAAFRTKQIDSLGVTKVEREALIKQFPDLNIKEGVRGWSSDQFGLKVDHPPFSDVRVRAAVSKALDRETMIETVYFGEGWFTLAFPLPEANWNLSEEEFKKAWAYDLAGAKKLMEEAGYKDGFKTTLICANYGTQYISMCEMIVDYLKAINIAAAIKIIDQGTYTERVFRQGGEFEMYYGPQGTMSEADMWLSGYYHSKGNRNANVINDPKLDKMIEEQRRTVDPAKRKPILQDILRYLLQQNYHLHVRGSVSSTAYWPYYNNRIMNADYPTARGYRHVWLDKDDPSFKGRAAD